MALNELIIGEVQLEIIHLPHFATKTGREFRLEDIAKALQFAPEDGSKAILCPAS